MKSETNDTINSPHVQWGRRWTFSFICWNCQLWDAILGHIYISHVCIILSKCYFSGHTCRVGVLMVVDTADIAQYPEMFEIYFHVWNGSSWKVWEINLSCLRNTSSCSGPSNWEAGWRESLVIDYRWSLNYLSFYSCVRWCGCRGFIWYLPHITPLKSSISFLNKSYR